MAHKLGKARKFVWGYAQGKISQPAVNEFDRRIQNQEWRSAAGKGVVCGMTRKLEDVSRDVRGGGLFFETEGCDGEEAQAGKAFPRTVGGF